MYIYKSLPWHRLQTEYIILYRFVYILLDLKKNPLQLVSCSMARSAAQCARFSFLGIFVLNPFHAFTHTHRQTDTRTHVALFLTPAQTHFSLSLSFNSHCVRSLFLSHAVSVTYYPYYLSIYLFSMYIHVYIYLHTTTRTTTTTLQILRAERVTLG